MKDDLHWKELDEDFEVSGVDEAISQKIHCEECVGHDDCPRMRGLNYCLGAEKWRRDASTDAHQK